MFLPPPNPPRSWNRNSLSKFSLCLSQNNLGFCYQHGVGTPQDYHAAAANFKLSAKVPGLSADPNQLFFLFQPVSFNHELDNVCAFALIVSDPVEVGWTLQSQPTWHTLENVARGQAKSRCITCFLAFVAQVLFAITHSQTHIHQWVSPSRFACSNNQVTFATSRPPSLYRPSTDPPLTLQTPQCSPSKDAFRVTEQEPFPLVLFSLPQKDYAAGLTNYGYCLQHGLGTRPPCSLSCSRSANLSLSRGSQGSCRGSKILRSCRCAGLCSCREQYW